MARLHGKVHPPIHPQNNSCKLVPFMVKNSLHQSKLYKIPFSFFLDKKRNKKIKAVINVGGPRNLLPESIKATFGAGRRLVKSCRNVAVMPS
ncbi:hypothetical protein [Persicobacter diffluens]|uniref:hypothetical protein n=1 Tax=Persicobacter diffluens TaxID=981 RepID=UPI0030C7254E